MKRSLCLILVILTLLTYLILLSFSDIQANRPLILLAELTHFSPVSNTGNNSTILVRTEIQPTVNGEDLTSGDEIGIFDQSGLCVGAGVWEESNLAITVWGDNPQTEETDGMETGEVFSFRIWDTETDSEYSAQVLYGSSDSTYTTNGLVILESLTGGSEVSGPHFSPVSNTGNNATILVTTDIEPAVNGESLTTGDEIGVFNQSDLCVGSGIWEGTHLAITVWGDNTQTEEADGMLTDEEFLFYVWDSEAGEELSAIVTYENPDDSGYTSNAIVILASLSAGTGYIPHFFPVENTGANATILVRTDINPTVTGVLLTEGDEIGVFAPWGLCVGTALWEGSNLAITVWGDNSQTEEIDGMLTDYSFIFRIWDLETGRAYYARATYEESSSSTYELNGMIILDSLNGELTVSANEQPWTFELYQNYPNPFNPSTTIQYILPESSIIKITVLNTIGQITGEFQQGYKEKGSYEFIFDATGLTSGLYFYRIETEYGSITGKMLFMK